MADGRTQILVALIGVAGVLGAAYIAKYGGNGPNPAPSVQPAVPTPGPMATEGATRLSQSQERAFNDAASVLDGISAQIEASSSGGAVAPDINGSWRDDAGYRFDFVQSGQNYTFKQYQNGVYDGSGQGTLSGRNFRHSFKATSGLQGTCTGEISLDLKSSGGTCTSNDGDQWQFFVKR